KNLIVTDLLSFNIKTAFLQGENITASHLFSIFITHRARTHNRQEISSLLKFSVIDNIIY
ncbi:MAG TPA: hypothetical protein PL110_19090, partial [Candidatus Eremiobacteraeota bacterium]|nr:hypothetical protein [Candidatus Eremiobacteraeota bacterium]